MDAVPADLQPGLTAQSAWTTRDSRNIGAVCVIILAGVVMAWHTVMPRTPSLPVVAIVVMQIALFMLSYWIRASRNLLVVTLAFILVLSMIGDCMFPQYSAYGMNAQLAAFGLLAYWTDDVCVALAFVALSAYQWIWLAVSSHAQGAVSSIILFIALYAVVGLACSGARHLMERVHRQQQTMLAMRVGICTTAMELHDAVSGSLTKAELLLRRCEGEGVSAAARDDYRQIHEEIGEAKDNVGGIVDLLLAEYGESDKERTQRRRIRAALDARDKAMAADGIDGRSVIVAAEQGFGTLRDDDMRALDQLIGGIYEQIRLTHPAWYELSITVGGTQVSIMQIQTGGPAPTPPRIPWHRRLRVHATMEQGEAVAMMTVTMRLHHTKRPTQQEAAARMLAQIQRAQERTSRERKG